MTAFVPVTRPVRQPTYRSVTLASIRTCARALPSIRALQRLQARQKTSVLGSTIPGSLTPVHRSSFRSTAVIIRRQFHLCRGGPFPLPPITELPRLIPANSARGFLAASTCQRGNCPKEGQIRTQTFPDRCSSATGL